MILDRFDRLLAKIRRHRHEVGAGDVHRRADRHHLQLDADHPQTARFAGRVVILFQPAEETAGGADDIVRDKLLETLGVQQIFALHSAPGLPVGTVAIASGDTLAGSNYFKLRLTGRSSHAAAPYNGDDVALGAMRVAEELSNLPARRLDISNRPVVVSITNLTADFGANNVLPAAAEVAGTLRAYEDPTVAPAGGTALKDLIVARTAAVSAAYVSSQAFVERYERSGPISTLLPAKAKDGLGFTPTHPKAADALQWMGLEARREVLKLLDDALADGADVKAIAYDLNVPEVVDRLETLGSRLHLIIDDDGAHGEAGSPENAAEARIKASAGAGQVKRQHMGKLQHNKMIVVDGPTQQRAIGGSTNFSWRGFYVQANNAVLVTGAAAIAPFLAAFDQYWRSDDPAAFGRSPSAVWQDLRLPGVNGNVCFSPHSPANAVLAKIGADIETATSNLLFSLAFLYQTSGPIREAVTKQSGRYDLFVYGISDRKVGGLDVLKPDGNVAPVYPSALGKDAPESFSAEPVGGGGTRMHHKFVVIDFGTPSARVYAGSYNFSPPADGSNGENLIVFRDPRVVASYTVEALRLFDAYHFRVVQADAKRARKTLSLQRPPTDGAPPWFDEDFTVARKLKDRELFA